MIARSSFSQRLSRRGLLFGALAVAAPAAVYTRYVEPVWLDVTEKRVHTGKLKRPVRLLHISDLHCSEVVPVSFIEKALRIGVDLKPDLICVTGDYVTHNKNFDEKQYVSALQMLPKVAPTFATFGNHDGGGWSEKRGWFRDTSAVHGILDRAGIRVLKNQHTKVGELTLLGSGDLWSHEVNADECFCEVQGDGARVVMTHNPDGKDLFDKYEWDLMLCGHTHGGQLSLPVVGTPFAPVADKRYVAGLLDYNGRKIHITRAIGNILGLRFNCRPEVSLLVVS